MPDMPDIVTYGRRKKLAGDAATADVTGHIDCRIAEGNADARNDPAPFPLAKRACLMVRHFREAPTVSPILMAAEVRWQPIHKSLSRYQIRTERPVACRRVLDHLPNSSDAA